MQAVSFGVKSTKSFAERNAVSNVSKWILNECISTGRSITTNQIMVTELQCYDPDCVPIETLIIILEPQSDNSNDKPGRWSAKILKPVAEVTPQDVKSALQPYFSPGDEEANREESEDDTPAEEPTEVPQEITAVVASSAPSFPAVTRVVMQPRERAVEPSLSERAAHLLAVDNKTSSGGGGGVNSSSSSKITNNSSAIRPIVSTVSSDSSSSTTNTTDNKNMTFAEQQKSISSGAAAGKAKKSRHNKEVKRQKGCPCCDPDSIENIIDKMLFLEYQPN